MRDDEEERNEVIKSDLRTSRSGVRRSLEVERQKMGDRSELRHAVITTVFVTRCEDGEHQTHCN